MASALDVQSTFAPDPATSLSLAAPSIVPAVRPAGEIADASGTGAMPLSAEPGEDGSVMALAGTEPAMASPETMASVAATEAMAESSATNPAQAGAAQQEMVAMADPGAASTQPVDPATARIYDAAGVPDLVASAQPVAPIVQPAKRTGGLMSLFSNNRTNNARKAVVPPAPVGQQPAVAELWAAPSKSADPIVPEGRVIAVSSGSSPMMAGLPGVNRERALGLNQNLSMPESPADEMEEQPIQLASAAGLARLAPNGLNIQREDVDVACLKPALVRVLKDIERHYGRKVTVTSGYRNPSRNKQARGAENSLHMYCSAADIQVADVSKWELASYLRTMPGRGGVGTYCYTESVHIDIGPQRDWNWRCRRKK
ncbi:MAG: D-Ala-D-Ala carboxypeptidase family metallohydrolase [Oricola sp.]